MERSRLACDCLHRAVVLFLDEVDRATMSLAGSVGVDRLPQDQRLASSPETLIIAAVNGGEHGSVSGREMDPAELTGGPCSISGLPSRTGLAGRGKVDPSFGICQHNRQHLEHTDDYEPNKVYPSRRSWVRFART